MPPSFSPNLSLVLPLFDAEDARQIRAPALERLLAYSQSGLTRTETSLDYEPWQSEVFLTFEQANLHRTPSAPTAWLGAAGKYDAGTWMHADPVRMELSADGMNLRTARAWSTHELDLAGKLFADLLDRSQMSWHVVHGRAFIRSTVPLSLRTVSPHHGRSRPLRESLPSGDDAPMLRRLITELQMVLHEKFVDADAPNAVWLWGAGPMPTTANSDVALPFAWTDDAFVHGLYRLHSAPERSIELPDSLEAILDRRSDQSLAVVSERRIDVLEQNWFAPALDALHTGKLRGVKIYLNGWHATAHRSWVRRWFSRPRPLAESLQDSAA